ncbi:MAG TPA: hypothetical protein VF641_06270, partial [Methylobacterium sp.]
MADDRLRMVAEVEDRATGPLGRIRTALGNVANTPGAGALRKDFEGAHAAIQRTQGAIGAINPVLAGLGIASFGAVTALGGAAVALRNFSSNTQQLSMLSRETGVTIDRLRAFGALGERFGVSSDKMNGAVQSFSSTMYDLRRRWGEVYGSLKGMNLGGLAEELVNAPNMEVALKRAMEGLAAIPQPEVRRRVSMMLFGTADIGSVADAVGGDFQKTLDDIARRMGRTSTEQVAAAQKFEQSLSELRANLEGVRTGALTPLLTEFNALLASLNSPGAVKVFQDELAGLSKGLRDTVAEFQQIVALWEKVKGLFAGNAAEQEMRGVINGGGTPAGQSGTRQLQLEGRKYSIEQQRELLDRNPNAPDYQRKRDRMTEELKRVGDELERLRTQSPTVQQQSFGGPAVSGGALIQKAAFGGASSFSGGYGGGAGVFGGGRPAIGGYVPPIPSGGDPIRVPRSAISPRAPVPSVGALSGRDGERSGGALSPGDAGGQVTAKYPDGLAAGIKQSAKDLGISAEDLATVISYETGGTFDKWKRGPTTKWGTHRGLIQWGEPQARKYGVTQDMSAGEQMQAVTRYLRDRGVKPGMGAHQVYGAINAGGVSDWHLRQKDAAAGGAPGTVRDKVDYQMGAHRRKGV